MTRSTYWPILFYPATGPEGSNFDYGDEVLTAADAVSTAIKALEQEPVYTEAAIGKTTYNTGVEPDDEWLNITIKRKEK